MIIKANADIVTDGSLGERATLTGNTLSITQELGQRVGNNLFHSFQEFNLNSQQTAIFSGSSDIQTVISRVTGNTPSSIDGVIRSTLPHANFYFLNPQGILFGEHAQLDISGNFTATTADSVYFQDGHQFSARLPQNSVLSVAPVESFGFIETPAPIYIQDSRLAVTEDHALSLIAGGLFFSGKLMPDNPLSRARTYKAPVDTLIFPNYSTEITAAAGEINLISVTAPGVVNPKMVNPLIENGDIRLDHTHLSTTGHRGGDIAIRGGLLQLEDAQIDSQTLSNGPGGSISIDAIDVVLRGDQDYSAIVASTQGVGLGGNLHLTARNLYITGGGFILNGSYGMGNSGDTIIRLSDKLIVEGKFLSQFFLPSGIISAAYITDEIAGNGGDLDIAAKDIQLSNGGEIAVTTYGGGHSGDIRITTKDFYATGLSTLDNVNEPSKKWSVQSGLSSSSFAGSEYLGSFNIPSITRSGNAGNIDVVANNIVLENQGLIISDGHQGNAGKINIHTQELTLTDLGLIGGSTWGAGKGGIIDITVEDNLTISNKYKVLDEHGDVMRGGIFTNSQGEIDSGSESAGDGGDVVIYAGKINISGFSTITTGTLNANGGNIKIISPQLLYVEGAEISTSVSGGKGNGGDILVQDSQIVVLNDAILSTQAQEGKGGNIRVVAQKFIRSPDSVISAASPLGIDGDILINSSVQDLTNELFPLSTSFLDMATLLVAVPCSKSARDSDPDQKYSLRLLHYPLHLPRATPEQWIPSD